MATIEPSSWRFAAGTTQLPAHRDLSAAIERGIARRMEGLRWRDSGWDGADARQPDAEAVVTATRLIAEAASAGVPEPELFPVPDGGVQVEWRAGPVELEVEPGGGAAVFVCDDEQTGQQIDGELPGTGRVLRSRLRPSPPTHDPNPSRLRMRIGCFAGSRISWNGCGRARVDRCVRRAPRRSVHPSTGVCRSMSAACT